MIPTLIETLKEHAIYVMLLISACIVLKREMRITNGLRRQLEDSKEINRECRKETIDLLKKNERLSRIIEAFTIPKKDNAD